MNCRHSIVISKKILHVIPNDNTALPLRYIWLWYLLLFQLFKQHLGVLLLLEKAELILSFFCLQNIPLVNNWASLLLVYPSLASNKINPLKHYHFNVQITLLAFQLISEARVYWLKNIHYVPAKQMENQVHALSVT